MSDSSKANDYERASARCNDWLIALALAASAFLIFAVLFSQKFDGLRSNDQFDYSQIARNLYRGKGFTTTVIKPLELAVDARIENHPDYWRPPLYPLMICLAYFLVGIKEYAGVLVSGFFFTLLAPLTFLFGKRLSGKSVAVSAAVILVFLPQMWDYSLHALTEMSFAFLLTLLLYVLYARCNPFAIGLVFGLCYLHRYNALVYFPAILWFFLVVDRYKWKEIGLFAGGTVLVSLPWLIRNTVITGNPMFSLQKYEVAMFTKTYPGYHLYATFDQIGPITMLTQHPGDLADKYMRGLNYLTAELPLLAHPAIMLFFLVSVLAFRLPRRLRFLLYATLIMIITQMHVVAIVHPLIRLFAPFLPIIVLYSLITFGRAIEWVPRHRLRQGLFVAAVVLVTGTSIYKGWHLDYQPIRAVSREEAQYVRQMAGDSAVVTDQPWELGWKADVVTIWAPVRHSDFEGRLPNVRHVFFSGIPFEPGTPKNYRWEYLDNPEFKGRFRLERKFSGGGMLFVRRSNTETEDAPD